MKKIIFAPDSFKGTIKAPEVCEIWQAAAKRFMPDALCVSLPLSDGGEGLTDTLNNCLGGSITKINVSDPLGRRIEAGYLMLPDGSAVVEMAAASGLTLLTPDELDPMRASTYGAGELILHAIKSGARHIILGLGGSATNDGGVGAAAAMGMIFKRAHGDIIDAGNKGFIGVAELDSSEYLKLIKSVRFTIACDVANPLCGPSGASAVFGPQKGAGAEQTGILDRELHRLSEIFALNSGRECAAIPGCGAAGGFALPILSYGEASIRPGIDIVLDTLEFDKHLDGAGLVISGEGCTDTQSAMGKVISGVAKRASAKGVPVVVLSGALASGSEALFDTGVIAMFSACAEPASLESVLANSVPNLKKATENLFRLLSKFL